MGLKDLSSIINKLKEKFSIAEKNKEKKVDSRSITKQVKEKAPAKKTSEKDQANVSTKKNIDLDIGDSVLGIAPKKKSHLLDDMVDLHAAKTTSEITDSPYNDMILDIPTIDIFELKEKLGEGGFGMVYKAKINPDLLHKDASKKTEKTDYVEQRTNQYLEALVKRYMRNHDKITGTDSEYRKKIEKNVRKFHQQLLEKNLKEKYGSEIFKEVDKFEKKIAKDRVHYLKKYLEEVDKKESFEDNLKKLEHIEDNVRKDLKKEINEYLKNLNKKENMSKEQRTAISGYITGKHSDSKDFEKRMEDKKGLKLMPRKELSMLLYDMIRDETLKKELGYPQSISDKDLDKFGFAIKIMKPQAMNNEDFVSRFETEYEVYDKCKDIKHIVNPVTIGVKDKLPYMVTEFLEGKIDNALLKTLDEDKDFENMDEKEIEDIKEKFSKKITTKNALKIILGCVYGLEKPHKMSYAHRDLKPENILFSEKVDLTEEQENLEEKVVLLDFGLAKDQRNEMTQKGVLMGTPMYLSPEQARETSEAGKESDIYSLGVTLFQMLTKSYTRLLNENEFYSSFTVMIRNMFNRLFSKNKINLKKEEDIYLGRFGEQERHKLRLSEDGNIFLEHLPEELNKEVDDNIAALIHEMLKKDPEERISLNMLKVNLERILEDKPLVGISARKYRLGRFWRRFSRKATEFMTAGIITASLLGTGAYFGNEYYKKITSLRYVAKQVQEISPNEHDKFNEFKKALLKRTIDTKLKKMFEEYPKNSYPAHIWKGQKKWDTMELPNYSTVGEWPEILWYMFDITKDPRFKDRALNFTDKILDKYEDSYSDIIGRVFTSAAIPAYELSGDEKINLGNNKIMTRKQYYKEKLIKASKHILNKRKDDYIYAYKEDRIAPYTMSSAIQLLLWYHDHTEKKKSIEDIILKHARATERYLIREDGSIKEAVEIKNKNIKELVLVGYQNSDTKGCQTRSFAKAAYGFALIYDKLKDERSLRTAEKMIDFYIDNTDDLIPKYDLKDPRKARFNLDLKKDKEKFVPYDSSSASKMLLTFQILGKYDKKYENLENRLLKNLIEKGFFVLDEDHQGMLTNACLRIDKGYYNQSLIFSDADFMKYLVQE